MSNKSKEKDILKEKKSLEIIDNFVNSLSKDKIKFDEFSMIDEIANTKIDIIEIQSIFEEKLKELKDEKIKTIKEI